MSQTLSCPNCGVPLPENAPAGHCPACLLRLGMAISDGGLSFALGQADPLASGKPPSSIDQRGPCRIGDYELVEEIAHGGMGVVYKARQVSLNRLVALKILRLGEFADETELARFRAESEAVAQLDHPNIVPIYEVGQHESRHYFTMKLVEGGPLSARIASLEIAPSLREAAKLLATVARAVHYAHQRGILHRDLKPGNILMDPQGAPHVTDFGLAKRIEGESTITMSGAVVGTPCYIPPEQAAGVKQLTIAADVYSLGAILYELLAKRPPFTGASVMETLRKVIHDEPVQPCRVREKLEAPLKLKAKKSVCPSSREEHDLDIICLKCLEKDPARRYGSAEALAEDLERWLAGRPIKARSATALERAGKWIRRNPLLAGSLATVTFVGLLGLAGILWQWRAAVVARHETQEELWRSQLLDARSYRLSSGPGRRAKGLEIVARAAAYRPSVELRNEAIATLVLPDLGSNIWWRSGNDSDLRAAFTSDLSHFTTRSEDGQIAIWQEAQPSPITRLRGLGGKPKYMCFSPDDTLLAVKFARGAIGVWRWREQQLLLQVSSWPDNPEMWDVPPFDFTPDGREFWLSDSNEQLARYSLPDGQLLPPPPITQRARRLRFDPTGRRLAAWAEGGLTAWDIATGDQMGEWKAPSEIWALAWRPSGDGFAFSPFQAGIFFAEIGQTNQVALNPDAEETAVFTSLAFTADGSFLLAGSHWGSAFAIWNFATRQQELRKRGISFWQLSRDGTRDAIIETPGYGVRVFEPPIGIRRWRVPTVLGAVVSATAWHPDGRWLVTGHPRGWAVWNSASGEVIAQYEGASAVHSVDFLPDGNAFLTGGGAGAQLWPFSVEKGVPKVGQPRRLTPPSRIPNQRAALSPDGKRFAAVGNYCWIGPVNGKSAPNFIEQGVPSTEVRFSPDGRWLYLGQFKDTQVKIRDGFTGAFVTNLPAGTPSALFTPGGDELLSVQRGKISFWQVGSWARLRELPFGDAWKHSDITGFYCDASCVLTIDPEQNLQLWSLEANREIATFWLPIESGAWGAAFDRFGRRMALAAARPFVDVWDLAAIRSELARLGLDWPGKHPSTDFRSRH